MRLCIHAGKHFEGACKTHSGEKSNKCNQCMFASSYTSALRTHLKRHSGGHINATSVTMHPLMYHEDSRRVGNGLMYCMWVTPQKAHIGDYLQ